MLNQTAIKQYGGKGAILNYVRESIPGLSIPNYFIKEHNHSFNDVLSDFKSLKKPVIVRSSSPFEYEDFEGIFESVKNVDSENELRYAIEAVERSAMSERAQKYAEINGFDIGEDMNVIIQEQSDSNYNGAIMRHPNDPDKIFIARYIGEGSYSKKYALMTYNVRTGVSEKLESMGMSEIDDKEAAELIEEYKKIESLTDISDDKVLYVEFGQNPFNFYQARPFKKKEVADFEVKPDYSQGAEMIDPDFVFGITPEEGIVYPVVRTFGENDGYKIAVAIVNGKYELEEKFRESDYVLGGDLLNLGFATKFGGSMGISESQRLAGEAIRNWHLSAEERMNGKPYCLMASSIQRNSYDTDLTVPNMKSLIVGDSATFLVHDVMRMFKKADVTVAENSAAFLFNKFFENTTSFNDKVRIISNGRQAVVTRE